LRRFAAGFVGVPYRGAEAPLFHVWGRVSVCLKAYPDTKILKIKSNGQECPFHTSNIKTNIKVKNGAECVRGSHSSQRTRGMGHPL
jgi:hypothetical protein